MARLGALSKFYVNGNGSNIGAGQPTPAWLDTCLISDLQVNAAWDEGDASSRCSRAKVSEPTMMGLEFTGKIRVFLNNFNAAYVLMYTGFYQDTAREFLIMNAPLNEEGAEGFYFQGKVFQWSEDQSLGAVLFKDFIVKPCIPINNGAYPRVARVISGVLTSFPIGQGGA